VLEHSEAGQGDQDEDEDGVEDAPQAPHQHQRVLLLADKPLLEEMRHYGREKMYRARFDVFDIKTFNTVSKQKIV
jgi:hypothetical protein